MVIKCTCKHEVQDKMYGPGMRVHNFAKAVLNKQGGYRCTVCKAIKPLNIKPEVQK